VKHFVMFFLASRSESNRTIKIDISLLIVKNATARKNSVYFTVNTLVVLFQLLIVYFCVIRACVQSQFIFIDRFYGAKDARSGEGPREKHDEFSVVHNVLKCLWLHNKCV